MSTSEKLFNIVSNEEFGRHLIANCDIEPGEIIIDEEALVSGPSPSLLDNAKILPIICISCYIPSYQNSFNCPNCNLDSFCSLNCSQALIHRNNECILFTANEELKTKYLKELVHFYEFITIARAINLQQGHPLKWQQISQLQTLEVDTSSPTILAFGSLKAESLSFGKREESSSANPPLQQLARTILGVFKRNSFSVLTKDCRAESLYFFSSFLSHSCILNTDRGFHNFSGTHRTIVRAARKINVGEQLTNSYIPILSNTYERNMILGKHWKFMCTCERCIDPTEFGTNFGVLECPKCLDPKLASRVNPVTRTLSFTCQNCTYIPDQDTFTKKFQVLEEFSSLYQFSLNLDSDVETMELHMVQQKLEAIAKVKSILDKILPGTIHLIKGPILFYEWLFQRELRFRGEGQVISSTREMLENAMKILQYAIPGTNEFHMKEVLANELDD